MKLLTKQERWYAFLEIIFRGSFAHELSLHHVDFGFLSDTNVLPDRQDEINDYIEELWDNPPEVVE